MVYYTRHELEIQNGSNDLIQELREFSDDANYALDENGDTGQECEWYDHENEIKSFSLLHPKVIFKLIGEGEEGGDLWHEYYMGGKVHICKVVISYPQFNSDFLV